MNKTTTVDEKVIVVIALEIEELEAKIAPMAVTPRPGGGRNHNESLVHDRK
jgi:hypothetical protein